MLPPSSAKRLRNMTLPHMSGGRAPPEIGLGAKSPYGGVTIAILGDCGGSLCTAVRTVVHVHTVDSRFRAPPPLELFRGKHR